LAVAGTAMGFAHVQSSPLTRSSYHAREAAASAGGDGVGPDDPEDAAAVGAGLPTGTAPGALAGR
jgi:hypothetical protein